jgi:hypothetical protein
MKTILIAAVAAIALSGCVASEEMQAEINAKVAAADDAECHSYGAATGTDAYYQCRMTKSQTRQAMSLAQYQVQQANFNHGLEMMARAAYPGRPF